MIVLFFTTLATVIQAPPPFYILVFLGSLVMLECKRRWSSFHNNDRTKPETPALETCNHRGSQRGGLARAAILPAQLPSYGGRAGSPLIPSFLNSARSLRTGTRVVIP